MKFGPERVKFLVGHLVWYSLQADESTTSSALGVGDAVGEVLIVGYLPLIL